MQVVQLRSEAEWIAYRRAEGRVSASMWPTVLGYNKWESPFALYHRLTGHTPDDRKSSLAMRIGTATEALNGEEYATATGRTVKPWPKHCVIQSDRFPWLCSTPDFTADEVRIVECKWAGADTGPWDDGPPIQTLSQLMGQMLSSDGTYTHGAVSRLTGRNKHEFVDDIPLHQVFIDAAIPVLDDFHRRLIHPQMGPPDPDTSESTSHTLKRLYPWDGASKAELPIRAMFLWGKWKSLAEQEKTAGDDLDAVKTEVLALLSGATEGWRGGQKLFTAKRTKYTKKPQPATDIDFVAVRRSK